MGAWFETLKADPKFPAYALGFIVFVGWMLNSESRPDEGWLGKVYRVAIGLIVGGLCGGGLYAVLH
ncbi:MAG: hypothetical protein U0166_08990 [Acidobacteriota bacterium]